MDCRDYRSSNLEHCSNLEHHHLPTRGQDDFEFHHKPCKPQFSYLRNNKIGLDVIQFLLEQNVIDDSGGECII